VDVELARQQWRDGARRVDEVRNRRRHTQLVRQIDAVIQELRKRVGQTFVLADLAGAYDQADVWARDVVEAAAGDEAPAAEIGTITDAAFAAFARGASDYRP
jgi:hypothetical protein